MKYFERSQHNYERYLEADRSGAPLPLLAIESSCDETAAAVLRGGREVLSMAVHTQIPIHRLYGGVVPELASRSHTERITSVVREALDRAGMDMSDIGAGGNLILHKRIVADFSFFRILHILGQCHTDSLYNASFHLNPCQIRIDDRTTVHNCHIIKNLYMTSLFIQFNLYHTCHKRRRGHR